MERSVSLLAPWTDGKPTSIATPHSRFFIRRLASGHLLLVNHYKFTGRSHLTAQLSTDERRDLERRPVAR